MEKPNLIILYFFAKYVLLIKVRFPDFFFQIFYHSVFEKHKRRVFFTCQKKKFFFLHNNILLTTGGKIKNAQNHRSIDARSEAEGSKPVV